MKHARPDYDRIQDPAGLIPEDEPVMLFRAQDELATQVLELYANLLYAKGRVEMAKLVDAHAVAFHAWPKKKLPDMP
jgi:hypothetical protein